MNNQIKYIIAGIGSFILLIFLISSCERIDAGSTGIKVNLYGSDKGVSDITEVTGMVWHNPFSTDIYEIPTFVQNVVYTKDENEGSDENEEFRVTTKDGLVVRFDVSMNYRIPREQAPAIFRKYRKAPHTLDKTIMRNYLREAFNSTASDYTASGLYEKRKEFSQRSEDAISTILGNEGFIVEQVVLLNELRLPNSVAGNIEAKINAEQEALRKEQELASARADAQKKIATSEGLAESTLIEARGQAEANRLLQRSLNNELLMQRWIDKWDGEMPQYSGASNGLPTPLLNIN